MPEFQRAQVASLCKSLRQSNFQLSMLFGPRQAGKTTIAKQALCQLNVANRFIAVDDPRSITASRASSGPPARPTVLRQPQAADAHWLVETWVQARQDANRFGEFVLALDGVRNIRNWSRIVKGLWDEDRRNGIKLRVVLLDSVPMLVQKGLPESLVGRFSKITAPYWSFREMNEAFGLDLAQYLYFGGTPGVFAGHAHRTAGPGFESHWAEYVREAVLNPTVDRDALIMEGVPNPALLRSLVALCGEFSGQIVSVNKVLGRLPDPGDTTTRANYLRVLESVGLFASLERFAGPAVPFHSRCSQVKLIALNSALMTSGSGYSFEQARSDRAFWSRLVENAVGAYLINTASIRTKVFCYRSRNAEVDFVLKRGPQVVGVDVGAPGVRKNPHRLAVFANRLGPAMTLVVGCDGVPLDEFLSHPFDFWIDQL